LTGRKAMDNVFTISLYRRPTAVVELLHNLAAVALLGVSVVADIVTRLVSDDAAARGTAVEAARAVAPVQRALHVCALTAPLVAFAWSLLSN
jgi:hypothetical protein